ncbi:MAG: hypothetical protein R3C56_24640 [Pirellulaceae bacterium]
MNNVGQRFHLTGMVLTTLLLIVASLLHALPWIVPHLGWLGPLGIAAGLVLATRTPTLASYLLTLAWSTVAISIAFHWSPQAMAYCVKAELPVGIVIATPCCYGTQFVCRWAIGWPVGLPATCVGIGCQRR